MNPHTRNRITPTNDVVSHSEARDIRNQLSEAEMDLTYLNERITATCAMLDKLMGQHRELTAEITEYRISLAPHKKLPPEILGTIFQYCITNKILILPLGLGDLLHLCHICSYWRRVALGTPTLWNRISVEIGSRRVHSFDILDVATTLLSRSGVSTPLSITLAVYTDSYRLDPEDPVRILINPYIHRYQEITLIMPPISFLPLLQLPVGSAEVLEVLDLEFDSDNDDSLYHYSWSDIFTFFNSAPRLRSVTLRSFDIFDGPEILQLASSQLTSLHFVDTLLNPDICHAMLRQCPNLINCTMRVETYGGVEESLADLDPIVVLNLRQFKLGLSFGTSFTPFLQPLILPALKDFGLTSHRNWQYDAFKSLLSRSSFDLERIALTGTEIDGSDLESLLQHMPFLVELDIRSQGTLNRPTLDMIIKGDLVPKLEIVNFASLPPDIAFNIIQSRWHMDADVAIGSNSSDVSISRLREATVSRKCRDSINRLVLETFSQEGLLVGYR